MKALAGLTLLVLLAMIGHEAYLWTGSWWAVPLFVVVGLFAIAHLCVEVEDRRASKSAAPKTKGG